MRRIIILSLLLLSFYNVNAQCRVSIENYNKKSVYLNKSECNIGFDMDKDTVICISSDTINLKSWDTVKTGGCMDNPGFLIYFYLILPDATHINSITLYENDEQVFFADLPQTSPELIQKLFTWYTNNNHSFSFKFCCNPSYGGITPYKIWDRATRELLDSGTIYGSSPCTTVNIPKIKGKPLFSGNGVINNNNGKGYFIPSQAGPGSHVITYSWDNEEGISGTYSKTVIVNPLPEVDLGNDTLLCEGNSIVLHAGDNYENYTWSDKSTKDSLKVEKTGVYSVTVTDNNGCINSDTINIKTDNMKVDLGVNDSICEGSSITLDAGVNAATYIWNDNSKEKILVADKPGIYSVTVSNSNCNSSDSIEIFYYPSLEINLGEDRTINIDTSIILNPGSGFSSYKWQDGSSNSEFTVNQMGEYWVETIDPNGCKYADTVNIDVTCFSKDVFIPDVFTPGSSNLCNSYFRLEGRCIGKVHLEIFNRWGGKVFWNDYDFSGYTDDKACNDQSHSNIVGNYEHMYYYVLWDGKEKNNSRELAEGTYFYVLTYSGYGENLKNNILKKGSITLIR